MEMKPDRKQSRTSQVELKQISEKLIITVVDTPEGEDVNSLSQGHDSEIFTPLAGESKALYSFN